MYLSLVGAYTKVLLFFSSVRPKKEIVDKFSLFVTDKSVIADTKHPQRLDF